MKVTIRGIDDKLYKQARHDSITENKTMGEIINEGLRLRQVKSKPLMEGLLKCRKGKKLNFVPMETRR